MTQSQTSTFMSSSFPYGGTSKGLSIHEREREAARIERERQLQNAEAVSLPTPLFPQPKKVQPCRDDRLQHNIQATLGDFNVLAPSMSHQNQYSLLGITNKVPQTPVNAGNKVFNFDNSLLVKNENAKEPNSVKNQKVKMPHRTKGTSQSEAKKSSKKHADIQRLAKLFTEDSNMKVNSAVTKLFSEDSNTKVDSAVKKESVVSEGSSSKPDIQQKQLNGVVEAKMSSSVKKEPKDVVNKHKPPKLSIHGRSPNTAPTESTQASSVERILEEMTQPGPPPLTAIHTPHKNNAQFAFPNRGFSLQHESPLANNMPKKEEQTNGLLTDDLHLSDDEDEGNDKSSSEDSDSDSSDSDSDSSGSDNSPPNSPVRSELNRPVKNGKLNSESAITTQTKLPSSTHATTTSSPSLNAVGGEGVRGDEAAPAPHANPSNSPLNTEFGNSLLNGFPFDLPVLSSSLFDESLIDIHGDGSHGFDAMLPAGIQDSLDPVCSLKPLEKQSPKVKHKEIAENGVVENSNASKKHAEKSKKHGNEMESKPPKQSKEKLEKSSKSTVKRKTSTDAVKLKSNSSNSSSKNSNQSTKEDSKTKKNGKVDEIKNGKSKKSSKVTPTKAISSDGENEEIDVVTVSNEKPFTNKTNTSDSKDDSIKIKGSVKSVNGYKETTNGKKPLSPLPSDEITLDCNYKPDALVVKIPLALLKRIPTLKGPDSVVISTRLENGKSNDIDSNIVSSPPRKAAKHQLSVECSDGKKAKHDNAINGESKEGRRHSTSSSHIDDIRRKRSPSRENDHYHSHSKRRRHDSESKKDSEKNREKSRERELENGHCKMNGWDRLKDSKTPQEHSEVCICGRQKEIEKRDSRISKLYDPEPRVPHGPDYYLREAKRVKHHADAIKDYSSKAYKYFESVLNFVNCGKALEQNNDTESRSAYQMYTETIEMLKYAMRLAGSRSHQEKKIDKRFTGLCLRLQSLLYMRLFKLRKDSMLKASKTLMENFKGQAKNTQAPSPYNASNPKTTGTPSPMSPTPSPSGSIGSVGSVGSAGSNETMTTPSRTNKMSSNCMTSPVNVSIPQKIHTMTLQHLGFTNHMLFGYDTWEQSQMIYNEYREFFMDLDRTYGPITLQSSIVDVVEYMQQAHQKLQET